MRRFKAIGALAVASAFLIGAPSFAFGAVVAEQNSYSGYSPFDTAVATPLMGYSPYNVDPSLAGLHVESLTLDLIPGTGNIGIIVSNGTCSNSGVTYVPVVSGLNNFEFDYTFPSDITGCTLTIVSEDIGDIVEYRYQTTAFGNSLFVVWYNDFPGTGGQFGASDTTRFILVEPESGTTVSTTTDVVWQVYMNENDYHEPSIVTVEFQQDAQIACDNSGALFDALGSSPCSSVVGAFSVDFDFLSNEILVGYNASSTEVTFPAGGKWIGRYKVEKKWLFGLFTTTQISTTTYFTIGAPSAIDLIREQLTEAQLNQASTTIFGLANIFASTTARLSEVCNPLYGLDIGNCLTLLIFPGIDGFVDGVSQILARPPWGYLYRSYEILTSGTTTPLPTFDYTVPEVVGGMTISISPWELFGTSTFIGSLQSSTSTGNRTLRDIAEPYWIFLWTLILIIAIIATMTGIHSKGIDNSN